MQGQRTTVESLSETYDIDHAHNTGSSVTAIDSQLYWNNVLNPPPSLPGYLISPDESNVSYVGNINHHELEVNGGAGEGTKVESGIPNRRLEDRRLSRGGINLNRALDGDDQELARVPSSGGGDGVVSQNGICPLYSNSYALQPEQAPSTSTTAGRLTSSLDGRRLLGKRKNMEGDLGQSSGSFQQSENGFFCNVSARNASSSSSLMLPGSENVTREGSLNPRTGAEQESTESSSRSFRMRLNPGVQADLPAPDWQSFMSSSGGQSTIWSPPQPSSLFVPVSESPEARLTTPNPSSLSQPQQLQTQGFPRLVLPLVRNTVPVARTGSSSNSPPILAERSTTIIRRNNNSINNATFENPIFGPTSEVRVVGQLPMDWSLANGSNLSTISGNPVSSSQVGSINPRAHYQNLPSQYPRTLSEFVRRTLPTANPDPGVQPTNLVMQRSSVRSSSPEIAPPPGVGLRGNHQNPLLRSAFLMDRRAGIMGAPLALRTLASSREGRSRMISEHIRNALDLMRRGENLRFEDVLILDHSAFYGLTDLPDRHRDMRLDVDNMSYEELLALEERIGNVNTGLSEEKIRKHLKHRMYLSSMVNSPDVATVEPCCVCQEDYTDGEDIGTLDCGHEFHSDCIKQWLAHKNICPICKMTALVT